jgi:hypothetical protein
LKLVAVYSFPKNKKSAQIKADFIEF